MLLQLQQRAEAWAESGAFVLFCLFFFTSFFSSEGVRETERYFKFDLLWERGRGRRTWRRERNSAVLCEWWDLGSAGTMLRRRDM